MKTQWLSQGIVTDPMPGPACAVCGKPRKLPATRVVPLEVYEADPFCSSACAKHWYGVQFDSSGTNLGPPSDKETALQELRRKVAEKQRERIAAHGRGLDRLDIVIRRMAE